MVAPSGKTYLEGMCPYWKFVMTGILRSFTKSFMQSSIVPSSLSTIIESVKLPIIIPLRDEKSFCCFS